MKLRRTDRDSDDDHATRGADERLLVTPYPELRRFAVSVAPVGSDRGDMANSAAIVDGRVVVVTREGTVFRAPLTADPPVTEHDRVSPTCGDWAQVVATLGDRALLFSQCGVNHRFENGASTVVAQPYASTTPAA